MVTQLLRYFSPLFFLSLLFLGFSAPAYSQCVSDATVEVTDESCPGSADGQVTVRITVGGQANYVFELQKRSGIAAYSTVEFSPEVITPEYTFTGLEATNYRIRIYDSQYTSCLPYEVLFSVETTGTTPALVSITGPAEVCENQTGQVFSVPLTAGSSYNWTVPVGATIVSGATGPDNNSITVDFGSASGNVTVMETNAGGCPGPEASLAVNVNPAPTAFDLTPAGTAEFCAGTAGVAIGLTGSEAGVDYILSRDGLAVTTISGTGSAISFGSFNVAGSYTAEAVNGTSSCSAAMNGSLLLIENPLPVIESAVTDVSCFGGNDGQINLTVTSSATPVTFAWSTGATSEDISGLSAGNYSVTVTDSKGCSTTTNFTVAEPAPLALTLTESSSISCSGAADGAIELAVSGGTAGYSYLWSTGATTQNLSGLAAGTYSVTVTDANGCQETASITLSAPVAISIIPTATDPSCNGGADGQITLNVTGGTGSYTYSWSNGASSKDISGLAAGTYTVTVTDGNQCTAVLDVILSEPLPISISHTKVDATTCGGTEGAIDLSVSGGTAGYTYSWSNGQTTEDLTSLAAGEYTVTVTDAQGCTAQQIITIAEPAGIESLNPTVSHVSCQGASDGSIVLEVVGGTSGYTYQWSHGPTTKDVSGLAAGTYTVTVTDATLCTAELSVSITEPAALSLSAAVSDEICGNGQGSIDLTVSGGTAGYTFVWSSGETTEDLTNKPAGTYTVTVTDAKGCTISQDFSIGNTINILTISETVTDASCAGTADGAISLEVSGGTAPYSYAWDNGGTTSAISSLASGTYTVTVSDANGCSTQKTIEVKQPLPLSISSTNQDASSCISSDGSIDLTVSGGTAPYTYSWNTGVTTEDLMNIPAGAYAVVVTDAKGCEATFNTSIAEPNGINSLSANVSPVSCAGGNNGSITLTVDGSAAPYTYAWSNGASTQDISNLTAGQYTVTVTDANNCQKELTVTVTEPAQLALSYTQENLLCATDATGIIDLSVSGGTAPYRFVWSNGQTSEDLDNLAAGTYDVQVTDFNNCVATLSVTITAPAPLVAEANITHEQCANAAGAIALTVSGGVPTYTYAWSNGATTANISGLPAGSYTVRITDANGCTINESYTVNNNNSIITIDATVTQPSCNGANDASIDLAVSGETGPYTFAWNSGADTEDLTGLVAGDYSVEVTDAFGCKETYSVSLTDPDPLSIQIDEQLNPSTCNGTDGSIKVTIAGGSGSYTTSWNAGAFTTEDIANLAAGEYALLVTDSRGCELSTNVVLSDPAGISSVTGTSQNPSCFGAADGQIDVTVTGGAGALTYNWNNGQYTTEDLSGVTAGIYQLVVTDANGCTANYELELTQPEAITATIAGTDASCGLANGTITISNVSGGTAPYSYSWTKGAESGTDFSNLPAGTYQVTVADAAGCSISEEVIINTTEAVTLEATATEVTNCERNNGAIDLTITSGTGPFEIQWLDNGTTTTEDRSNLAPGDYSVFVVDANGCSAEMRVNVPQSVDLFTVDYTITAESCTPGNDGAIDLTVSNGSGDFAYSWGTSSTDQDLSGLTAGTYQVTVTDNVSGCASTIDIEVPNQAASLLSNASLVQPGCTAGGSISLSPSGGQPEYAIVWQDDATAGASRTDLTAGSYTVTITDAAGCSLSETYTLLEPETPAITAFEISEISCFGGTATATVSSNVAADNANYIFTDENGVVVDGAALVAGSYTVVVENTATACVSEAFPFTVGQPTEVTATITGSSQICAAGEGNLSVEATGGTYSYTYLWSTGSTEASIQGLDAGDYEVTVTDGNGCAVTASFTIENIGFTVDLGADRTACTGETITLDAGYAADNYTFVWSNGATTPTIAVTESGTYSVTVSNAAGCTSTDEVVVTIADEIVPSIQLSNSEIACDATQVTVFAEISGGGDNPTIIWTRNGTAVAENQDQLLYTFDFTAGDVVTAELTSSLSCASGGPVSASIEIQPSGSQAATVSLNGPTSVCEGQAVTYTATATNAGEGAEYIWYLDDVEVQRGVANEYLASFSANAVVKVDLVQGTLTCGAGNTATASQAVTYRTAEECAGGGFNCGTFTAVLLGMQRASCDERNGALFYEISGGTAPYFVEYIAGGDVVQQSMGEASFTLNIQNIPAGTVEINVRDAAGRFCNLITTLEQTSRVQANLTKATDGDVACYGEASGRARLVVEGGNAPYQYLRSEEEGWLPLNGNTLDFTDLPAGLHNILVRDSEMDNCPASVSVEILHLTQPISLSVSNIQQANCNDNIGSFQLDAIQGGYPEQGYEVKLGNESNYRNFEAGMVFEGLARGQQILQIRNGQCETTEEIYIPSPGQIVFSKEIYLMSCEDPVAKSAVQLQIDRAATQVSGPYEASISRRNHLGEYVMLYEALPFDAQGTLYQDGLDRGEYMVEVRTVERTGCPENHQFTVESSEIPTPVTFVHNPQHIYCEGEVAGVQISSLSGAPDIEYVIDLKQIDGDFMLRKVVPYSEYSMEGYGRDGVLELSDIPVGKYELLISQDQQICGQVEYSEVARFEVKELDQKLSAEVIATTESFPERGSGSLTLQVETGSGVPPYVASLYLVRPLFVGQSFVSENDTVHVHGPSMTYQFTYQDLPAGSYELYITDANGCSILLETAIGYDENVFVPNVFTPNGDGFNDVFYIRNIPASGTRLIVTNRWGMVVYDKPDYQNDWDGGSQPEGIYYYTLKVSSDASQELKGWLEIRRGSQPK